MVFPLVVEGRKKRINKIAFVATNEASRDVAFGGVGIVFLLALQYLLMN